MSKNMRKAKMKNRTVEQEIRRRTIISFSLFFALLLLGYFSWRWLNAQPDDNGVPKPFRTGYEMNESVFRNVFSGNHLAKTYSKDKAVKRVRVNGNLGLSDSFDYKHWKLKVVRKTGDTLYISLNELRTMPKTEVIFDFKCIEGWSQVTHWAGVRFSDFVKKYNLDPEATMKYVGLVTPDKGYYVGIDMPSMMHPQTILCYEMNGQLLPLNQGFPLRLIIPVKYGIKHLKRIGTLYFSNTPPPDYWAEQGYDYYSGL
ncbi:MAG: molybdopterin-dependent oxidoreductase [Bacteroidetes bacterium]|nr:molybdopterin-dependent oxidoreductase [Bacteroidota bacterium]